MAEEFELYCREKNARGIVATSRFCLLVMLVVGPIEYWLLANRPETAAWQRLWMITVFVVFSFGASSFYWSKWAQRNSETAVALITSATLALAAVGVAQVGGLETLYVGIAYVVPMVGSMLLMPLWQRTWITFSVSLSFFVVFFAIRPESLSYPFVGVSLFHASLAVGVAILFGHLNYVLARENFERGRQLEGETERLDRAVQERTQEVMELARNLVSLEETERTRIARELHDELGQQLTAIRLESGAAGAAAQEALGPESETAQRAAAIEARVALAQQSIRDVVFSLRPPALDDFDLQTALRLLVDRFRNDGGPEIVYRESLGSARLSDTQATTVFRVLQEAMTNVARHAGAARITVDLGAQNAHVDLRVADDGRGISKDRLAAGFGLRGVRERLRLVGGQVSIAPRPEGGTLLHASFPLARVEKSLRDVS